MVDTQLAFDFGRCRTRKMVGRFDGGHISTFGGVGLLAVAERITGICRQVAQCFTDHRNPDRIERGVRQLVTHALHDIA